MAHHTSTRDGARGQVGEGTRDEGLQGKCEELKKELQESVSRKNSPILNRTYPLRFNMCETCL